MDISFFENENRTKNGTVGDKPPVQVVISLNGPSNATCIEATRDGIFVFVGTQADKADPAQPSQICIVNALRSESVSAWDAPGSVCSLRLSSDDRLLAVLTAGGDVAILSCIKGPPFLKPYTSLKVQGLPIRAGFSFNCAAVFVLNDEGRIDVFHIPEPPPPGQSILWIAAFRPICRRGII